MMCTFGARGIRGWGWGWSRGWDGEYGGDSNVEDDVPVVGYLFPEGPKNISVFSRYAKHVAVLLWFNTHNVSFFIL